VLVFYVLLAGDYEIFYFLFFILYFLFSIIASFNQVS